MLKILQIYTWMLEHSLCLYQLANASCCKQICSASNSNLALVSLHSAICKEQSLIQCNMNYVCPSPSICRAHQGCIYLPVSNSFLNWTYYFSTDIQSMPFRSWNRSQKRMKKYSHVLNQIQNKVPDEVWKRIRDRGTEDIFHDLLIFGSSLVDVCKYFLEQ